MQETGDRKIGSKVKDRRLHFRAGVESGSGAWCPAGQISAASREFIEIDLRRVFSSFHAFFIEFLIEITNYQLTLFEINYKPFQRANAADGREDDGPVRRWTVRIKDQSPRGDQRSTFQRQRVRALLPRGVLARVPRRVEEADHGGSA